MRVALLGLLPFIAACTALAQSAAAAPNVKQRLLEQGYRPSMLNGQLLYCRVEAVTGTQFHSTVCLSEAQISEQQQRTRNTTDSRALHPNLQCTPKDCPH